MFNKIMLPVDLAHTERLEKAITVAAGLARDHGAELCFIGVTTSTPSALARSPEEFGRKLASFAEGQGKAFGITATSDVLVSHDPSIQMDRELEKLVDKIGADLVVMATHIPNATDYVWSGHGAHIAAHSDASVFLVR
ncbi:MAG: universal stress protein UspA [Rhodobacterales bacterium]|nr:MAG: universal stress protein UspA [Rhodobacterales bacterium]